MGTYIPDRLKKLRTEMAVKGLDAVLITKRENYIWLSGFTGTSAWLVITADEAVLTTDFRYGEQAAAQAPEYTVNIYQGNAANALKSLIDSLEVRKLGFEDYNMTFEQYTEYSTKFTDCEMIALGSVVQDMREIKDPGELLLLKKAVEIADAAFSHIIGCIRPGMTEMEVAAEMEHHMRRLGAAGPSFETIIASGERSSLPHGLASDKRLAAG
ncbi:MAG: aminopeptidase P family protein, partial [Clostridiales bacterium]|nr:aminopeptidase P family protein [Clostridiales bacterium]